MKTPFFPLMMAMSLLVPAGGLHAQPVDEFTDDEIVPCIVHQTMAMLFPNRLYMEGISRGEASLMVEVHADGQLGDILTISHSHKDFADVAIATIRRWEFTPAMLRGEPIASNITVNVNFSVDGVTAYTKRIGQAEQQPVVVRKENYRAFSLLELDGVPMAIAKPGPAYPTEWIDQGITGAVTVDFFIDEDGETRFVHVVGRAHPLLEAVSVDAVKHWRFEPPTRFGRPALAKVRQVFYFRPGKVQP
jgi:TonB family protein